MVDGQIDDLVQNGRTTLHSGKTVEAIVVTNNEMPIPSIHRNLMSEVWKSTQWTLILNRNEDPTGLVPPRTLKVLYAERVSIVTILKMIGLDASDDTIPQSHSALCILLETALLLRF